MKYLSKLMSMLLIGSMLWTVGCAKYDDEIKDLNNKIDNLESMMNDQITPMETDLEAIKTQLTKLTNDTESLTATHKSDLETLTKANEELVKRIKALEDANYAKQIADAIADFNEAVAGLNTQDEAFKTQLASIIADVQKYATQIDDAVEAIEELNGDVADLQTQDEAFVAQLATISQSISNHADMIAAINDNLAKLQAKDEAVEEAVEEALTSLSKNITKVDEALAEYKVVVNAKINALEARIEAAEGALKDIEETVIPGLESQIAANEAAIAQNTFNIQLILTMLDVMSKADMAIQTLVHDLEADVDARILEVSNTIAEQFGKCWNEIFRVENEMKAEMDVQMLEIEALRKALNTTDADLAYLKATVDKNYEELANNVAAVKNHLEEYKAVVTKEIEAAVNAAIDVIKIDIVELQNKLSDVNAKYNELQGEFKKFQDETNKRLTSIEEDLEAINNQLAAMIQNITFVPTYNDGLATAVRVVGEGNNSYLTATTLTAVFEVTPASAASVIAKNGCVAVEPLKTRAEVLRGERLAVEVIDAEAGRVKVTAFVHNMPKDYNTYAFTLNVEVDGKTVASSDYVHIYQSAQAEYTYTLVTEEGNESIEKHPNWSAERKALVFEKKWTKASDESVKALEGYVYKLADEDKKNFFSLAEIEKKHGMAEGALAVTIEAKSNEAHEDFIIASGADVIDMKYDNEYLMFDYINREAEVTITANNSIFKNPETITAYYKITGVDVVDGEFIIEEEGDLYWLSQNQDYVFNTQKAKRVLFAEKLQLDMAGYCDAKSNLAPYKAISTPSGVSIEGNNSMVQNIIVEGTDYVGLFGYVKGSIANLTVTKATIEGNHHVGAIAGRICGSITNCHVDGATVVAAPRYVNDKWDDGDKAGAIVGYSEPNSANGASEPIENCSAKNSKIVAFRDLGGIVGAMNYGNNIEKNTVENVKLVAVQRESKTRGYYQMNPNIGRILGRDVLKTWVEAEFGSNKVANADLRICYAIGAEVNVNSFDAKEHTLELSTANGLAWFSNHVTDHNYYTFEKVTIVNDIDFGGELHFAEDNVDFVGISNNSNGGWRNVEFNGMNKTISNFKWDEPKKNIALFGTFRGDIKNIKMENVELKGLGRVAPIAAQCWGHIDNCHVNNLVISVYQNEEDGDKLGGIVAQMQADGASGTNNLITNCSVKNADIEGFRDLGGLAGHADLKEYDGSNTFENVTIWVNQTHERYEAGHYPFKNEHEVVGRVSLETSAKTPADVEGVEIYNILYADLGRHYVNTPSNQLRLGYAKCNDVKENTAALYKFAEEYTKWNDVFQVTDMQLEGIWNAIGTSKNPFMGIYDGNGKSIKGLKIVDYSTTPSGFFGFARGTMKSLNIVSPVIYGSHYAGAVAAHMFGTVMNCKVTGGEIVLMPNYENGRFDNGDKAGALVGYLADTGIGNDKILNNTVDGVKVKAYRDVAALVGCAHNIDAMSGNTVKNCHIIVDQITGKYPAEDVKTPNIGMYIGRLVSADASKVESNIISNSTLGQVVEVDNKTITEQITTVEIGSVGK